MQKLNKLLVTLTILEQETLATFLTLHKGKLSNTARFQDSNFHYVWASNTSL